VTTESPGIVRGFWRLKSDGQSPSLSILDRETLPDFIHALVERVEARVKATVVKIKNIAPGQKAENPVMALDVKQHRFDCVTDEDKNTQHCVHRIPRWRQSLVSRTLDFSMTGRRQIVLHLLICDGLRKSACTDQPAGFLGPSDPPKSDDFNLA
jgi:hypothetical protein